MRYHAASQTRDPTAAADGGLQTVRIYLLEWLSHVRGRVRASTFAGYESLLRLHAIPAVGHVRLVELQPLQLQGLYGYLLSREEQPLSAGSVLNLHLVLTQAFGQAVRWRLLPVSPAVGTQPPRPQRPLPTVVDQALARRLLEAARGTPVELPAALALATGMRRGEVLALRWIDLDEELTQARVRATLQPTAAGLIFEQPKTSRSRRTVVLPAFVQPYLRRQRQRQQRLRQDRREEWREHDLVVDRGDGGPVNPDSLSSAWRRLLRQRGLPPVRFHDLRHGHATLMLLQGVHPKIVSERLGHASIGITLDIYSHVLPSMQNEAAAAFDQLFSA